MKFNALQQKRQLVRHKNIIGIDPGKTFYVQEHFCRFSHRTLSGLKTPRNWRFTLAPFGFRLPPTGGLIRKRRF